jgi:hypothetical protein
MSQLFQASSFGYTPPIAPQWQRVQLSSFNAQSNRAYPVNTSVAIVIATLPPNPNPGDTITFVDYAGTFSTYSLLIYAGQNRVNGVVNGYFACTQNRQAVTIAYVDAIQGWVIQSSYLSPVSSGYLANLTIWGGGGGATYSGNTTGGGGGGAGAATGSLVFTSGTAYAVVIGGGGASQGAGAGPGTAPTGGGGTAGSTGYGGQGGGYSGLFLTSASQANAYLIAGGGGGGGEGGIGGYGGGTTGSAGANGTNTGGGGGTQSAGGAASNGGGAAGSALQGGSPGSSGDGGGGGAGGGGYWGGGSGAGTNPTGAAGGGGSGYYNPSLIINAVLYSGSGSTPGNSSDPLRGTYGNGGATHGNNGNQGVVIVWYPGAQRGTGGTITSSAGNTYHTFTTAGTYTA